MKKLIPLPILLFALSVSGCKEDTKQSQINTLIEQADRESDISTDYGKMALTLLKYADSCKAKNYQDAYAVLLSEAHMYKQLMDTHNKRSTDLLNKAKKLNETKWKNPYSP